MVQTGQWLQDPIFYILGISPSQSSVCPSAWAWLGLTNLDTWRPKKKLIFQGQDGQDSWIMAFSFSSGTCSGQMNCLQVRAQNPLGNEQRIMCKHWLSTWKGKKREKTHIPFLFFILFIFFPPHSFCFLYVQRSRAAGGRWRHLLILFCRKANSDLHPWGFGVCSGLSLRNLPALPDGLWAQLIHLDHFLKPHLGSYTRKNLRVLSRWRDFNPFKLLQFYSSCLI